ncbi:6099_t:CDS:2, partial [Cetraspora pellucida]
AKNAFEKDFFKLMNNSVYGKTIENVRKYQDVKLMAMNNEQDEKKFINQIRKPSFKYARQLGNTLVGAHMGKASVTLNKPIIVRASVLGLSKLLMYRFWYGYIKERYGDKAQLGYMNTDSFIFQTIGLFKDETPGNMITESYHIRAKSYHYVLADKSTKSKHKGVSKKSINEMAMNSYMPALEGSLLDDPIDRSLLSEQEAMRTEADPIILVYRDCLFNKEVFYAKNVGIRSKDHILSLIESEKKALCPIDTKPYKNFVSNGISSELAEQRALSVKLSKKYQNEYVSHIS